MTENDSNNPSETDDLAHGAVDENVEQGSDADGAVEPPILKSPRYAETSQEPSTGPSELQSAWMSKRSLEPVVKVPVREQVHGIKRYLIVGVVFVVIIIGVIVGMIVSEQAANAHVAERIEEIEEILDGATNEDFLSFGAARSEPGSVAQQISEQPGFVNVNARADLVFIRIQPDGWWIGFAERCIIIDITPDETLVNSVNQPCVQIPIPERGE